MQVPQPVLEVLSAAVISGDSLVLTGQLDRKLYTDTNKVLEAAGGKWNRKAKAHLFEGGAAEAIEPIILTGEYQRTKQDFGQFDSPTEVVDRLIELADIRPGMRCYEPSAGLGNIVAGIISALGSGAGVFGNEIDPKRHAHCVGRHHNAFGSGGLSMTDFLTIDPTGDFDRVVMNPPFARQADIDHVFHAHGFLNEGGRLVSVMSSSVRFRQDRKAVEFREWVEEHGGVFEDLPAGSFKASGTGANTCILTMDA